MDSKGNIAKVIDAISIAPQERHHSIFQEFRTLKTGEVLEVIAPHDPAHLLQHMIHEGLGVDQAAYYSRINPDNTYSGFFTKKGGEEIKNPIRITSFEEEKSFSDAQFHPVEVYKSQNYKVILAYLKAGQFIPVHSPTTDLILSVFKGNGTGIFGELEEPIKPGSVIVVPGGEKRGIRAITDMEILHIVSPIPDEHDHREVKQKLIEKKFK